MARWPRMTNTVSWTFALGLAAALSAISFSGSLAAQHRAEAECALPEALPWCGMGAGALATLLLFAGIGFLLLAALCGLAASRARHAARVARRG